MHVCMYSGHPPLSAKQYVNYHFTVDCFLYGAEASWFYRSLFVYIYFHCLCFCSLIKIFAYPKDLKVFLYPFFSIFLVLGLTVLALFWGEFCITWQGGGSFYSVYISMFHSAVWERSCLFSSVLITFSKITWLCIHTLIS